MEKVSVVIPTFNRIGTVYRAIESALDQTRKPLEIVVVDDGSTDGTEAMVSDRFGDRIRYLRQENTGVARKSPTRRGYFDPYLHLQMSCQHLALGHQQF